MLVGKNKVPLQNVSGRFGKLIPLLEMMDTQGPQRWKVMVKHSGLQQ